MKVVALSEYDVNCTAHAHFYPCRSGKLEIVKYLIRVQRCSAGCTDNSGLTPLHLACK